MGLRLTYGLVLLGWLAFVDARSDQAAAVLMEVAAVRNLTYDQAEQGLPVLIKGQVVLAGANEKSFFLRDADTSIYVQMPADDVFESATAIGMLVEVSGRTIGGDFLPAIQAERVDWLGSAPLPEARPLHHYEIFRPEIDCDWVDVVGRLVGSRRVYIDQYEQRLMLRVEFNDAMLDVMIPYEQSAVEQVAGLMFNRVKFQAVAGTQFNGNRQMVGRIFYANSIRDFEVVDDIFSETEPPLREVHQLMQANTSSRFEQRTQGEITQVNGTEMVLRGDHASIAVRLRRQEPVRRGDYVEILGFVRMQKVSPSFLAREVRILRHGTLPEPVSLKLKEKTREFPQVAISETFNEELVVILGELVDMQQSFGLANDVNELTMLMRHRGHLFEAKVRDDGSLKEELEIGSDVELVGICKLERDQQSFWRYSVDRFSIHLRDKSDLRVVAAAPWWNTRRLAWATGLLVGILGLIVIWLMVLRRTVEKQTGIIGRQIEQATIADERQRIARELHDNLEQGLAGMALQLRGAMRMLELNREKRIKSIEVARSLLGDNDHELEQHFIRAEQEVIADAKRNRSTIEVVQGMLTHCSQESRSSIMDLRGSVLERLDLVEAMRETLKPLAEAGGVKFELTVEGQRRRFTREADRHALLVAKEAVTNAVRHAKASCITVTVCYVDEGLSICVQDDGCGFDVKAAPVAGHFGLQGMRERINQLNGRFEITSSADAGTTVSIVMESMEEWEVEG